MTGTVGVWSSASCAGRTNGVAAPQRRANAAVSSSSVETTMWLKRPDSFAAVMAGNHWLAAELLDVFSRNALAASTRRNDGNFHGCDFFPLLMPLSAAQMALAAR